MKLWDKTIKTLGSHTFYCCSRLCLYATDSYGCYKCLL